MVFSWGFMASLGGRRGLTAYTEKLSHAIQEYVERTRVLAVELTALIFRLHVILIVG